jgi:hypothetical protein
MRKKAIAAGAAILTGANCASAITSATRSTDCPQSNERLTVYTCGLGGGVFEPAGDASWSPVSP